MLFERGCLLSAGRTLVSPGLALDNTAPDNKPLSGIGE
jgi:hypothetical protein